MRKASDMQLKAISHVKGPARVIAGPGSGKTFTIVQRIIHLIINHQVNPEQILTITFTKVAALEMQSRYLKESENYPQIMNINKTVNFGTFHSICYTILKDSGLINDFLLVKESEKRKIMEIILRNLGIESVSEYDAISKVLDAVSRKKNYCDVIPPLAITGEVFENIFFMYNDMLSQQKLLDFDDMILKCLTHLKSNKELCRKWQEKYSYILVDEFQDINEVQYQVIKLLAAPYNNLFVVGDDDQSIYGFRGSAPGIMHKFMEDYPLAKELFLSENYRSGNKIIKLADKVIKRNKIRFEKEPVPLRSGGIITFCFQETRHNEEERLLKDIRHLSEKQLMESAVIVRTNMEACQYIALLKQNGIPVRERYVKKESPVQSFVAEDFAAFLRFCFEGNKRCDFLKIMNKPNLFLTRQSLTSEKVKEEEVLFYYRNNMEMYRKAKRLFHDFHMAQGLSPSLALRYFRKVMGYDKYLEQKVSSSNKADIIMNADFLQELFKEMKPGEKTDDFLKRTQENRRETGTGKTELTSGISVITMHGAKGLEFECVFLPDLNEGIIPGKSCKSEREIEEERRLLYVAITRAKNSLYLYYTKERNRKLTRFLEGLHFDE